ncbi:MAG: PA0069 family radical SAM protein [Burkholderiales bacterium]
MGVAQVGQPVQIHRGRGAVSSPQPRFNQQVHHAEPDGWLASPEPLPAVTRIASETARSLISRNQSPDVFFDQSVNPYRGCEHGCIYCYARPNHAWVGLSPGLDFETRLFAKLNAPEVLARELDAPGYRCAPIVLGTATDAYQPVEREYQLTRQLIQVMAERRHPLALITKSSLVERDIDLLAPMAAAGLAAAYVTVTTLDPELARRWEPRAPAPWRRLETIRKLSRAGIPVGVMVAPLTPFLNEPELEQVLQAAHEAGARSAHYTVLRLPQELDPLFRDWLAAHYPQRAARVLARLADMRPQPRAGRQALNDARFHHRMRGQGPWAELIRLRFQVACQRLGLRRDRPSLRTDAFQPARAPAAESRASRPGQAPVGALPGCAASPSAQLALFPA